MKILIVDDDRSQRESLAAVVASWKYEPTQAGNGVEALKVMATLRPDVIVTDLKMPLMDGFELLRQLRNNGEFPPTIVLTAFGSLEMALSTVHDLGGYWFLEKPINLNALSLLLQRAATQGQLQRENEILRRDLSFRGVLCDLVGSSPVMQEVFQLLRLAAPTTAPVLISGESGTGKELAARAIHQLSPRRNGPFIAVNCAALPETLVESEIFGHERGAFTGAASRRMGSIEMAEKGTLFLDELTEMPVQMQAKLLRVLQDFRYHRLGGTQEIHADVRVIAATNRKPLESIQAGLLREDLYYRLTVFQVLLPPLRERREDIEALVRVMIQTLNQKYGTQVTTPAPEVLEMLTARRWDGNVRELRNVVERAVVLAREGPLLAEHIAPPATISANPSPAGDSSLGIHVGMTLDQSERALIEATLANAGNNKTQAAAVLGISTKTLHAKLNRYRAMAGKELPDED